MFFVMSVAPSESRCVAFADYVLDNDTADDAKFHQSIRSEEPSERWRTNNGCESFHCRYNEQFYTHHPCVYSFTEMNNIIYKAQCTLD